ncbi:PDZ domain-containing protein [Luteolibacter sp. AS25]|uniref:PDZ domain-containing protein n=1 Tax=Luteolibacter sp. AS25 TaxID=3135776 RepID=UPI00398B03DE
MSGISAISGRIRRSAFSVLLLVCFFPEIEAKEIPLKITHGLESEQFEDREVAQKALLKWALASGDLSITSLAAFVRQSDDPEVSHRAFEVLRELSDRDYLVAGGKGYLGIRMEEVELPELDGVRNSYAVLVVTVLKSTPAEEAGLKNGDIIAKVNGGGWKVQGAMEDFRTRIGEMSPAVEVSLLVLRGDERLELKVKLGRSPVEDIEMLNGDVGELDRKMKDAHFKHWLRKNGVEDFP